MSADSPTDNPTAGQPAGPDVDAHAGQARLRQVSGIRAEGYDAQFSAAEGLREHLARTEAERRDIDLARLGWLQHLPVSAVLDLTVLARQGGSVESLLQVVLQQAVRLFEARKSAVFVPDEAGRELVVAAARSLDVPVREDVSFPLGEGVVGRAWSTREMVVVDNTAECDYFAPGTTADHPPSYLVCAPLEADGEVLGVLSLERPLGLPAGEEKLAQLDAYARHAAVQLRNIKVYERLLSQINELSVLCEISRTLSSSLEHEALLQRIVTSACGLLHCEICSLMLFDDDKQTLHIRHAVGLPEDVVERVEVRSGEGVSGWVAESGEPLLIEDISTDPRFSRRADDPERAGKYRTRSLLSVPLLIGSEVVGVLNVNNKANDAVFTERDRGNLSLLASQAAVSIENARLYETLQRLAVTDPLTKLFRRNYFEEQIQSELGRCRRYRRPLSVLMLDIDHFKGVNDTYGHQAGDVVLRGLAGLLRRYGRKDDLIARFGGEEFVAYLVETDREGALLAAERVRAATAGHLFDIGKDKPIQVTVSIGYATYPEDGGDGTSLVQGADLALYAAKRGGRNRVEGYQEGMSMEAHGT